MYHQVWNLVIEFEFSEVIDNREAEACKPVSEMNKSDFDENLHTG